MAASLRCFGRMGVLRQILPSHAVKSCQKSASRWLQLSSQLAATEADFHQAKERLNTLKEDPGNEAKLKLYALFKQATAGKVSISRPGMMDFVGRAKWDAWNELGSMTQEEARQAYISVVDDLAGAQPATSDTQSADGATPTSEDILLIKEGSMATIKLNRPGKFNALKVEMYDEIRNMLDSIAKDDSISVAVFTGEGKFYCSGNDLSNFTNINPAEISKFSKEAGELLRNFVAAYIDFPKPLIAVVNGPAVGISVTLLGLFDAVYATDKATFKSPFTALGQSPEGCSSYLFPRIMGDARAKEMLLFNRQLTAQEAHDRGLVTEVFPDHVFQEEVWKRVTEFSKLPKGSLRLSKCLIRDADKVALHAANERECDLLVERWQSTECMQAVMDFFSRKP